MDGAIQHAISSGQGGDWGPIAAFALIWALIELLKWVITSKNGNGNDLKVLMGRLYEQMAREAKILDKMTDKLTELEVMLRTWDSDE